MKPFDLISRDAQQALTEFSTAFDSAMAMDPPVVWAKDFGLQHASRAIKTVYPIPVSAAGYVKREGDDKMRSLFAKSLSISPIEWIDGIVEQSRIIEAPDFIGWGTEPKRIADEATRLPNRIIADLLAANAALEFDGLALFHDAHPVNIFDSTMGTFDNNQTAAAFDSAMMRASKLRFRQRKGPNGKPMGRRMTDIIVPAALEEIAKDFLESDLMLSAALVGNGNTNLTTNNRFKGTVNLVVADELAADNIVYAIDRGGPPPYVLQDGGSVEEIQYNKDSELWKDTGKIAIKYLLLMGAAGALPHSIERITIG